MLKLKHGPYFPNPTAEHRTLCKLIEDNGIEYGNFTLSSGVQSNYYIDLSLLLSTPKALHSVCKLMCEQLRPNSYDAIGGPAIGAMPLIVGLGLYNLLHKEKHMYTFWHRKDKGEYLEGELYPYRDVLLVDDVVTTGKSLDRVMTKVLEHDCKVISVMSVIDRQQGAPEYFAKYKIPYMPLFIVKEE